MISIVIEWFTGLRRDEVRDYREALMESAECRCKECATREAEIIKHL